MAMFCTPRVRAVEGMFGIWGRESAPWGRVMEVEIPRVGITLSTGASGSGKTRLLRVIEEALRAGGEGLGGRDGGLGAGVGARGVMRLEGIPLPARAVVDCFAWPLEQTLALLCRAGLAEARVWLRSPRELSEGERFRYRLARWMAQSRRRILIADEFCNGLDRITARGVAWQLRRFVAGACAAGRARAAIVATAHEDLAEDLRPAVHVRMEGLRD